jgi:putative tryptophan/tyrosine transport system substrate-binding protein
MGKESNVQGLAAKIHDVARRRSELAARSARTATRKILSCRYLALAGDQDAVVIKQRLGELGYIEGKNLIFDFRSAEGQPDRLSQLAADFVKTGPDVLVAGLGTLTAKAAKAATTKIPVVFVSVGDPVGVGLVESLARPGRNITGLSAQAGDLGSKRLQFMLDILPNATSFAVMMNPQTPANVSSLAHLRSFAELRNVDLKVFELTSSDQVIDKDIEAARRVAAGLIVLSEPLSVLLRKKISELALQNRLPSMYADRMFAHAGGLMSFGPDRVHLFLRAAEYVAKILAGNSPQDLPVEQPTKFELVINLKTAKAIGVKIPEKLIALADEVIE